MRYRHSFEIAAPVEAVDDFHRRPESLRRITPPVAPVRIRGNPPQRLAAGDELSLTFFVGIVPVRWRAVIEAHPELQAGEAGFQDRQLEGPFRRWTHRHRFVALSPVRTRVDDEIDAEPRRHPLWGTVALQMWLGLPVLFRYREWKTRRLLGAG